jgi:hypothetical protein
MAGIEEHELSPPDVTPAVPIDESGSSVFTEWGVDLPFVLQDWGKFPVTIHTI